jgi:acyl-CoA dehydrogenase
MSYDIREFHFILNEYLLLFAPAPLRVALAAAPEARALADAWLRRAGAVADDVGASYQEADVEGCALEPDGRVRIPAAFRELWQRLGGTIQRDLQADAAVSAQQDLMLLHVRQLVTEMLLGANPSFMAYGGFTHMAIPVLASQGTRAQQELLLPPLRDGRWDACFCATEAEAGSDLGDVTTLGQPTPQAGVHAITGEKIYITCGQHDLTENTVHFVLGRTAPGASLSCFLTPRLWPGVDGRLIDNHVRCIKVDDKMGLRGCANTHLSFGRAGLTRGLLLGDRAGIGLVQVAPLMTQARISTAQFGLGIATRAYLAALGFARRRRQGRRLGEFSAAAPRIAIVGHADVQRMLLEMKAVTEACRMMMATLNGHLAIIRLESALAVDAATLARARALAKFFVPLLKAYVSDQAWRVCELAIQVHGGTGFLRDSVVEQCARDVKVLSLWEGTNYIQALDLLKEKLRFGRNSQVWRAFREDFETFLRAAADHPPLAAECAAVREAYVALVAVVEGIGRLFAEREWDAIGQFATRLLACFGDLYAARVLLEAAIVALVRLAAPDLDPSARAFYCGKVKSCRFFVFNQLPELRARAAVIGNAATSLVTMADEEFGFTPVSTHRTRPARVAAPLAVHA